MKNITLIDFFAEWCIPCDIQDKILEKLKEKYEGKIEFRKIDTDKESEIANKYNISSIPTLILEKDEKVVVRHVGVTSMKILEEDIERVLK
jgi:thioredoxin 1